MAAVDRTLSRMNLDGDQSFASLSAGMKRRVLLAQAIVQEPDLLLLDEPTNHLDIESILWLESFLKNFSGSLLFVTHDRMFLQSLATRILEIDRGRVLDWECDYPTFLRRKAEVLAPKKNRRPFSISGWPRKKFGFGKGSKPSNAQRRASASARGHAARTS